MRYLLAVLLFAVAAPAWSALGDFNQFVRPENLKPFARDVGGVLGAASVDTGRSWGFPGFEAGVVSGLQFRPDRDDTILRNANIKAFGMPLLSVGVGLPARTSVVVHGFNAGGVKVVGGGARFSLFEAPAIGSALPQVGVSFFGDHINHVAFSGDHYAANVAAGWALPILTPFANVGYDLTKISVSQAVTPGVTGQSAWARGMRIGLGTDITPLPLLRLRLAYQILHGISGATADLLFKF